MKSNRSRGLTSVGLLAVAMAVVAANGDLPTDAAPLDPDKPTHPGQIPAVSSAMPAVALIATAPGGTLSELYFVAAGHQAAPPSPVASWQHALSGTVRAQLLPDSSRVVANALHLPSRDDSFAAALFLVDPASGDATVLCEQVVYPSRPLVTAGGRVFVTRGRAGQAHPGQLRSDELSIAEVHLATAQVRTVLTTHGYYAHLAGSLAGELFVYRVGPSGADIIAVEPDQGTVRVVLDQLPPFARDFSVDPARAALVFRGRHESDTHRWTIEELDVATGTVQRLHEGPTFAVAPAVWPGGDVAFNPARRGLQLLHQSDPVQRPLGSGVDVVRGVSRDERFVALLHTVASALPQPFVVDRTTAAAARIWSPAGARVAVAGFVETDGGAP